MSNYFKLLAAGTLALGLSACSTDGSIAYEPASCGDTEIIAEVFRRHAPGDLFGNFMTHRKVLHILDKYDVRWGSQPSRVEGEEICIVSIPKTSPSQMAVLEEAFFTLQHWPNEPFDDYTISTEYPNGTNINLFLQFAMKNGDLEDFEVGL